LKTFVGAYGKSGTLGWTSGFIICGATVQYAVMMSGVLVDLVLKMGEIKNSF
jgi:quinol-cytochrome oxidoreductase complex cytochrome b subunit